MKQPTDSDAESETSFALDDPHYPEQHELGQDETAARVSHAEIARRAHELWLKKGRPEGSAEQDWFEAVEQLRAFSTSQNSASRSNSGSVQI